MNRLKIQLIQRENTKENHPPQMRIQNSPCREVNVSARTICVMIRLKEANVKQFLYRFSCLQ